MSALSLQAQRKSSLSDMELIAHQQAVAITQLEKDLQKILEENEQLLEKQKALEIEISEKEAAAVQRCIALDFRLAQASAILPCKRRRIDSEENAGIEAHYKTGELNPAVNFVYQKAYEMAQAEKTRLQQSFDDLIAWKFTPDSATGRRLMARMRDLLEANEKLGSANQVERLGILEEETRLQAAAIEEQIAHHEELESYLQDSLTDLEGAQSILLILKQQLTRAEELIRALKDACEEENPGQADALIAAALATFVEPSDLQLPSQNPPDESNTPEESGSSNDGKTGDDDEEAEEACVLEPDTVERT